MVVEFKDNPYPLAKDRKFWLETLAKGTEVLREVGGNVPVYRYNDYWSFDPLAEDLHRLGYALYSHSLGNRDWGKWWQLQLSFRSRPRVGSMVIVTSIRDNHRYQAVGQLLATSYESLRNRRYHFDDKGPPGMCEQYHIRRIDGRVFRWTNAGIEYMPTIRDYNLLEKLDKEIGRP